MNKSEQIRMLARSGSSVSDISRTMNVRYQFAYNVCQRAGLLGKSLSEDNRGPVPSSKPALLASDLTTQGFQACGPIRISAGSLSLPETPKDGGVYAIAQDGVVQYVGVASRSLSQRLRGYARPGPAQTTNRRVSAILLDLVERGVTVELFCACPPDFDWNGLVIKGALGLEAGLILHYHLPWNIRGA